ncbi:unnamed protein product [Didymodactylos carnosus]|uniref:ubiquitinyl hydrolase 1 n=1 Tax=Didymodactylos carnosus TaxID=1234261 RepID=A0A8S2H780_9BILA|nr:unnamed protein product [Didymodactylos carnosus]CAF3608850.1 unnamed protein product [Didymodactylos carnosus]
MISQMHNGLLYDDCIDECDGVNYFIQLFEQRYQPFAFRTGVLEQKIKNLIEYNERPLILYLHNDKNVKSDQFCRQIFCSKSMTKYLVMNYFVWPWDFTFETNKQRQLLKQISSLLGIFEASIIDSIPDENYPLFVILIRNQFGDVQMINLLQSGNLRMDDFYSQLVQSQDLFKKQHRRIQRPEIIYHEKQRLQLCALHSLNNLFQAKIFKKAELGMLGIDMFCDNYLLIGGYMNSEQRETCVAYYRNALSQPWYTQLVILAPILIGFLSITYRLINSQLRTIYDIISLPLFCLVVYIFAFGVKTNGFHLAKTNKVQEQLDLLINIAYGHLYIIGILAGLFVLQLLAHISNQEKGKLHEHLS